MNQRLTENEKQNQIEINQLYEKLASFEDNSQIQDIVVANYNKLRESYQNEITKEMKIRESLENENGLLRSQLSEKSHAIDQLTFQNDTLKQKLHNQHTIIESLKVAKEMEPSVMEFKPTQLGKPSGNLPMFEPAIKMSAPQSSIIKSKEQEEPKFIPTQLKFEAKNVKEENESKTKGRAGMKNKKHCTIDCIFSDKECENCGRGRGVIRK